MDVVDGWGFFKLHVSLIDMDFIILKNLVFNEGTLKRIMVVIKVSIPRLGYGQPNLHWTSLLQDRLDV